MMSLVYFIMYVRQNWNTHAVVISLGNVHATTKNRSWDASTCWDTLWHQVHFQVYTLLYTCGNLYSMETWEMRIYKFSYSFQITMYTSKMKTGSAWSCFHQTEMPVFRKFPDFRKFSKKFLDFRKFYPV